VHELAGGAGGGGGVGAGSHTSESPTSQNPESHSELSVHVSPLSFSAVVVEVFTMMRNKSGVLQFPPTTKSPLS